MSKYFVAYFGMSKKTTKRHETFHDRDYGQTIKILYIGHDLYEFNFNIWAFQACSISIYWRNRRKKNASCEY